MIEKRKTDVSRALNRSIENEGSFNNRDLVVALENWGTSENVVKLAQILDRAGLGRSDVIRILGKIRDPNGLKAVARRINNFFDKAEVQRVLRNAAPWLSRPSLR